MTRSLQAVVLCGGLGTRLRGLLPYGVPKVLVPITDDVLFIDVLLETLTLPVVLAPGYGAEVLAAHVNKRYPEVRLAESCVAGTWPAVCTAARLTGDADIVVLNGDTYCELDLAAVYRRHLNNNALLTVVIDNSYTQVGCRIVSPSLIKLVTEQVKSLEGVIYYLVNRAHAIEWVREDVRFFDVGTPSGLESFRQFWRSRI